MASFLSLLGGVVIGLLAGWLIWGRKAGKRPAGTAAAAEPAATTSTAAPVAEDSDVDARPEPAAAVPAVSESGPVSTAGGEPTTPLSAEPGPAVAETVDEPGEQPAVVASTSDPIAETRVPVAADEPAVAPPLADAAPVAEAEPVQQTGPVLGEPAAKPAAKRAARPAAKPAASPVAARSAPEPVVVSEPAAEPVAISKPLAAPEPVTPVAPNPEPVAAVPGLSEADNVLAEPAPIAVAIAEPDDLTKIAGIGPKTAMALAAAGITTFRQVADADPATLRTAIVSAGLRSAPGLAGWPEKAEQLVGTAA